MTIAFRDLVRSHGRAIADRALEYGRHFFTDGHWPDPFWVEDDLDEILALMVIEDARADER